MRNFSQIVPSTSIYNIAVIDVNDEYFYSIPREDIDPQNYLYILAELFETGVQDVMSTWKLACLYRLAEINVQHFWSNITINTSEADVILSLADLLLPFLRNPDVCSSSDFRNASFYYANLNTGNSLLINIMVIKR